MNLTSCALHFPLLFSVFTLFFFLLMLHLLLFFFPLFFLLRFPPTVLFLPIHLLFLLLLFHIHILGDFTTAYAVYGHGYCFYVLLYVFKVLFSLNKSNKQFPLFLSPLSLPRYIICSSCSCFSSSYSPLSLLFLLPIFLLLILHLFFLLHLLLIIILFSLLLFPYSSAIVVDLLLHCVLSHPPCPPSSSPPLCPLSSPPPISSSFFLSPFPPFLYQV